MLDPDTLGKVAKSHPSLLETAKNISTAVLEEHQSAGRGQKEAGPSGVAPAARGERYYLDDVSDDEMEVEDGGMEEDLKGAELSMK